jgi:hypothetical protein
VLGLRPGTGSAKFGVVRRTGCGNGLPTDLAVRSVNRSLPKIPVSMGASSSEKPPEDLHVFAKIRDFWEWGPNLRANSGAIA